MVIGFLFLAALPSRPVPAHLKRTRKPENGVNTSKHECPDQKPGHAPEGPEEQRVLLRVMMRGVREIPGEAACCPCMALLARCDNVFSAQMRAGIADRENVMRPVAIVTLGGLGVAKL